MIKTDILQQCVKDEGRIAKRLNHGSISLILVAFLYIQVEKLERMVYFCYIDESGTPQIPGNTSHYVLCGVSIPVK